MIVLVLVSVLVFILINNGQVYEFVQERITFKGPYVFDERVLIIFLIVSIVLIYSGAFFRKQSTLQNSVHRNVMGAVAVTLISGIFVYFLWTSVDYRTILPGTEEGQPAVFRFINWGFVYLAFSILGFLYLISLVMIFFMPEDRHIFVARIYVASTGIILFVSTLIFDNVEVFVRITIIGLALISVIIFISIFDIFYTLKYPGIVYLKTFVIFGAAYFAVQLLESGEKLRYDFDRLATKQGAGKDYVDYARGLIAMPAPTARVSDQIASIAIRVEKVHEKALDRHHSLALSRDVDSIENDFLEYLKQIDPDKIARSPIDVVLVTAEGGGLYAAYQTAIALAALSDYCPEFHRKIFAMGATSGGSVGAALFASLLRDARSADLLDRLSKSTFSESTSLCEGGGRANVLKKYVRKFFDHDFLTPTLAGFILGDLPQVLFFGRGLTDDRAVSFRKSLERAYDIVREEIKRDAKDKNLGDAAPLKQGFFGRVTKTVYPRLFFQATLVETGQLVVIGQSFLNSREFRDLPDKMISDVKDYFVERNMLPDETEEGRAKANDEIEDLTNTYGQLAFDFNHILEITPELDLSVSEAASVSARFPIIAPSKHVEGVQIVDGNRPISAKFVDGGYFDNKGLSSMLYVLMRLKRLLLEAGVDHHVKFHMLNIVNSKSPKIAQLSDDGPDRLENCKQMERPEGVLSFAPILLDPIRAIYNTNRAKEENISSRIRDLLVEPVEISIDRISGDLPLTWFLSKEARDNIDIELGIDTLAAPDGAPKNVIPLSNCSKRSANEDAFRQFLGEK